MIHILTVLCFTVSLVWCQTGSAGDCPKAKTYGTGACPSGASSCCQSPSDTNNLPPSKIEEWFTKEMFNDLFPFANLGWGPSPCSPYSYEAFVIAARYFPNFGTSSPNTVYTADQNYRRDLASFFAHAIQETGENNVGLYNRMSSDDATNCFYRGGFYNWFEGGPTSSFLDPKNPGYQPKDGGVCTEAGRYCSSSPSLDYWYPCGGNSHNNGFYTGCYFGRGAVQISYNYNYGQFGAFLKSKSVNVDLLANPNLVFTNTNPPLALMASLWFYMTPQPPKPAMHDIVMGSWNAGSDNSAAGYSGPIFGPTSLIINNECNGEDPTEPGGAGESRRIKAFKWFCKYFNVPTGDDKLLTCKGMPQTLDAIPQGPLCWAPDWHNLGKSEKCNCVPANYSGIPPYYDSSFYPSEFADLNEGNRQKCVQSIYDNPAMYNLDKSNTNCLNF